VFAELTAFRASASLFVLAAAAVCVAAVTTDMLPTQCGVVGRPIVAAWAIFSIVGGALLLVGGITAGFLGSAPTRRRVLVPVAIIETVGWVAALLFYLRQTGGSYPNCL
jgi:hypothetical protein